MPIRDVRRYADLVRDGDGNEQERLDLLRAHRQKVLARLAEVQDHLGAIDYKIGIYEDRLSAMWWSCRRSCDLSSPPRPPSRCPRCCPTRRSPCGSC